MSEAAIKLRWSQATPEEIKQTALYHTLARRLSEIQVQPSKAPLMVHAVDLKQLRAIRNRGDAFPLNIADIIQKGLLTAVALNFDGPQTLSPGSISLSSHWLDVPGNDPLEAFVKWSHVHGIWGSDLRVFIRTDRVIGLSPVFGGGGAVYDAGQVPATTIEAFTASPKLVRTPEGSNGRPFIPFYEIVGQVMAGIASQEPTLAKPVFRSDTLELVFDPAAVKGAKSPPLTEVREQAEMRITQARNNAYSLKDIRAPEADRPASRAETREAALEQEAGSKKTGRLVSGSSTWIRAVHEPGRRPRQMRNLFRQAYPVAAKAFRGSSSLAHVSSISAVIEIDGRDLAERSEFREEAFAAAHEFEGVVRFEIHHAQALSENTYGDFAGMRGVSLVAGAKRAVSARNGRPGPRIAMIRPARLPETALGRWGRRFLWKHKLDLWAALRLAVSDLPAPGIREVDGFYQVTDRAVYAELEAARAEIAVSLSA